MPEDNGEMPWEKEGEEFDAEKAKQLIINLRNEKKSLQDRNRDLSSQKKTAGSTSAELQKENDKLKIQLATGLNDRQVARLVGDTLEEKMADAEAYAEETGIELRSFLEPEAEGSGTPQDEAGAEGNEDEQKPPQGMNYRAPAQKQQGVPEVDLEELAKGLVSSR